MGIHPTAIIGKNAVLGDANEIGPYVIIEDGAKLGSNNKILSHAYICAGTEIGNQNEIHMGAVIGHVPQDLAYQGTPTGTKIGNQNVIREYVTIHRGTKEGTNTVLGNNNFLMANVHVAHNCQLGNQVVIVNGAGLAGYCVVEDQVFLSGMTVFHQFSMIGRLAMVSALSAINKDIPPFMMCGGRGAVVHGINVIGMKRAGINQDTREEINQAYKLLYRSELNTANALVEIERVCHSLEAKHLINFIKNSKRGIASGRERETDALKF
jgi:UDP-N-acetylglucosamine acyltransferase